MISSTDTGSRRGGADFLFTGSLISHLKSIISGDEYKHHMDQEQGWPVHTERWQEKLGRMILRTWNKDFKEKTPKTTPVSWTVSALRNRV